MSNKTVSPLEIEYWKPTGFQRVCRVEAHPDWGHEQWIYTDIDYNLMYSEHRSWVYLIVVDQQVYKIGESGNPLGIISSIEYQGWAQPKKGTTSRLGRYIRGGGTDWRCREELLEEVSQPDKHLVEFWALACPENYIEIPLGDNNVKIKQQIHKHAELVFLATFVKNVGRLPQLNVSMK